MAQKKYLDQEGVQYLWSKVSLQDYPNNDTLIAVLNAIDDTKADKDYVETLYKKLNSNATLGFYCIEDVTVIINDVSTVYPANSSVEIKMASDDVFEIVPTSDNSILSLTAFPGALGTYYSWLEGVKQFSNILFDMNAEDMYTKWNQGNQGAYQVQFAQYSNCIFWSDNPYINDLAIRTNYTLYNSAQLPLCYSSIPENTFKAFYLAMGVTNDPNWSNSVYKESFANATWATQVFSYYGARVIGTPEHFSITLPADCRGLMFYARNVEAAGTFDATNVTKFGAGQGSWREAFGYCSSLRRLYISNLKVNLNISWSPVDYDSIYYIISNAANTSAITISVSPYTYNLLSESDFELATSKNITITLLTTNYVEDKRLSVITLTGDGAKVLSDDGTYKTLPTNVSELANDAGYLTEHQDLSEYATIADVDTAIAEVNVQSDWEQNDAKQIDYVKNKPFGEISIDITKELEMTYIDNSGAVISEYSSSINPIPEFEINPELSYTITFTDDANNSTTETVTPYEYNGYLALGDSSLADNISTALIDGVSSYFYGYINDGYYLLIDATGGTNNESRIFTINITASSIKQLDEQYLPSSVFKSHRDLGDADLNEIRTLGYYNLITSYTYINTPDNLTNGALLVYTCGASTMQLFVGKAAASGLYTRRYIGGAWTNWVAYATLEDMTTNYYTKEEANNLHNDLNEYIDTEIANLVNSAPETLNTLGELATAIQESEEVVDALNEAITTRVKTINNIGVDTNGNISILTLPEVTETDNGKILMVVNGVWTAVSLPVAEEAEF